MFSHDELLLGIMGKRYSKQMNLWRLNKEMSPKHSIRCSGVDIYPDALVLRREMPTEERVCIVEVEPLEFDVDERCNSRWIPLSQAGPELHLYVPKSRLRECRDVVNNCFRNAGRILFHVWYTDDSGFHVRAADR